MEILELFENYRIIQIYFKFDIVPFLVKYIKIYFMYVTLKEGSSISFCELGSEHGFSLYHQFYHLSTSKDYN